MVVEVRSNGWVERVLSYVDTLEVNENAEHAWVEWERSSPQ